MFERKVKKVLGCCADFVSQVKPGCRACCYFFVFMSKVSSILLVDDDDASNFINELLIKKSGITDHLAVARNGRQALDLIISQNRDRNSSGKFPDLILLDINMPEMNGFGFLDAFKEVNFAGKEHVVTAVLTTSLNPRDEEKVRASGVEEFLNKPLTKEKLQVLVNKYFG